MTRAKLPALETTPGRLHAFAIELVRVTESGDWLQMAAAARESPWFRIATDKCPCCGTLQKQTGFARAGELVQGDLRQLFESVWIARLQEQEEKTQ